MKRLLLCKSTSSSNQFGEVTSLNIHVWYQALDTLFQSFLPLLCQPQPPLFIVLIPSSFQSLVYQVMERFIQQYPELHHFITSLHQLQLWYFTSTVEFITWFSSYFLSPPLAQGTSTSSSSSSSTYQLYILFMSHFWSSKKEKDNLYPIESQQQWIRIFTLLQSIPNWTFYEVIEKEPFHLNNEWIQLLQKYSQETKWIEQDKETINTNHHNHDDQEQEQA